MGRVELWPEGEYYLRIPKRLFEGEEGRNMSVYAKLLYGILLDATELSRKNGCFDESGEIFVYYSVQNAARILGCCKEKAIKTFRELESLRLVTRVKKGNGRQDMIYVRPLKTTSKPFAGGGCKFG